MPDDAAIEKAEMLRALGAEVQRMRPVSITHPDHFVNVARRRAAQEETQYSLINLKTWPILEHTSKQGLKFGNKQRAGWMLLSVVLVQVAP